MHACILEKFHPHSRPPTVAKQLEIPGTIPNQPWLPGADSHQFFVTSQQRPTFAETAVTSGVSRNAPSPNRSKTLEEEIEDLLAFGEQLKQRTVDRPIENQLHLQDQRRPFVEVQEPFTYASAVKSRSDVSYQNPIKFTEAQKQMLRLTGTQVPAGSTDNPVLNPRLPMNGNLSMDQPVRTMTNVELPTETRIFNQLYVETYQPNRVSVEPSYQRQETLDKPSRDQKDLFVRLPTPMNNHTLSNNVARHETVNRSRYVAHPANQQVAGEWNRIGPWNAEKDTSKYATTVHTERSQQSRMPPNVNAFPNYIGSSGQEFQDRKATGNESAMGFNGFENQSSIRSGNEPWTSEGNHKCVILYSEDGRQVLIPQSYIDSTMASQQADPSRRAIPERLAENVSNRMVQDVALDSRITQQQMGQRAADAGGEGQMIDRNGLRAPEYYTIRRQVPAGSVAQQQQAVGATRVETVRSGSLQAPLHSQDDAMQRRQQFYSQNSDSVFASPPPAVVR